MKPINKLMLFAAMSCASFGCTPAHAQSIGIHGPRGSSYITFNGFAPPAAPARDLRTQEEIDARTAAWEARCRPTVGAPDPNTGVRRYEYAAKGCEFGD